MQRLLHAEWSSPVSNSLLFEGGRRVSRGTLGQHGPTDVVVSRLHQRVATGRPAVGGAHSGARPVARAVLARQLRRLQQQLGGQRVRPRHRVVHQGRPSGEGGVLRLVRAPRIVGLRLLAVRVLHQHPRRAAVREGHQREGVAAVCPIRPGLRPRPLRAGSLDGEAVHDQRRRSLRRVQRDGPGAGGAGQDALDAESRRHPVAGDPARALAGRHATVRHHARPGR